MINHPNKHNYIQKKKCTLLPYYSQIYPLRSRTLRGVQASLSPLPREREDIDNPYSISPILKQHKVPHNLPAREEAWPKTTLTRVLGGYASRGYTLHSSWSHPFYQFLSSWRRQFTTENQSGKKQGFYPVSRRLADL